ncbi:MAG: Fur family transcriptional regulator [Gemmatimonadota bacterium]|nr:Fur family transcriptional regulator [Gemmatimonadota bacterium]
MPENLNKQFLKFLRENGFLVTRQRRRIAEVIFSSKGHLSVEDIQDLLRKRKISASIASIYRTLDVMVQSGLVVQHRFGKRFKRFEAARMDNHHDHLVCIHCNKVFEFRNDTIEKLQVQVAAEHGFEITSHKLEIYGYCSKCKADGAK